MASFQEANICTVADQPTNTLISDRPGQRFQISFYGSINNLECRSKLSQPILKAFESLLNFEAPHAKTWLPKMIEVIINPSKNASGKSISWPSSWPSLSAPTTKKSKGSYRIFLPSIDLKALKVLLKSRQPNGTVEIDGKQWAVDFRYPFPGEDNWEHRVLKNSVAD